MTTAGHDITGDEARQAIDAIRGYAYQIYSSALAWLQIDNGEILHLEVAEDFAVSSETDLVATQSKATSKNLTIRDSGVLATIDAFFDLSKRNPGKMLTVRFLTTSAISSERDLSDRIDGRASLLYWQKVAVAGDVTPLRALLEKMPLQPETKTAIQSLSDDRFREDVLKRIIWDTGAPGLDELVNRLRERLLSAGTARGISHVAMAKCAGPIVARILEACTNRSNRSLSKGELDVLIADHTSINVPVDLYFQQQKMMQKLLEAQGVGSSATLQPISHRDIFRPIMVKAAIPSIAPRHSLRQAILNRLNSSRCAWLHAGTGFGKTTIARFAAFDAGGTWKALNVRDLADQELSDTLYGAADALAGAKLTGVLLDDLENYENGDARDALAYFCDTARGSSCLLLVTSYSKPSEGALASFLIPSEAILAIPELNESDISQVVSDLGGNPEVWSKYVYLASGSGHPQLVQAFCRNLAARHWPFDELRHLHALLGSNSELAKVRNDTRKRLVEALQPNELDLLTRLSLIPGKFDRESMLQLGDGDPPIANPGFAFDALVGPWINEPYDGVYQLSPLVSDLALKTVPETRRLGWQRLIAISFTSGKSLDAGKMNAAFIMAIATDEKSVLMKIAVAVMQLDPEDLAKVGIPFFILQTMRADHPIYKADTYLNILLRFCQFLLLANETEPKAGRIEEVWERLQSELAEENDPEKASVLDLMVLSKSVTMMVGRWKPTEVIQNLARIHEITTTTAHEDLRDAYTVRHDGEETSSIGVMLLMHAQGFQTIEDTFEAFKAIDGHSAEFRQSVFAGLTLRGVDSETYFSSPWLKEHAADTIDPPRHSKMYRDIAVMARNWGLISLAVSATKYEAVILDEYGNEPDEAMNVLARARTWAGSSDWDLIRGQAKVEYRRTRYPQALDLFKKLTGRAGDEGTDVEQAFMFRDAGISAANVGDWAGAAAYFARGRTAAINSDLRSMQIMATGFLGDIGITHWKTGDVARCVDAFENGLTELSDIKVDESLNAKHCHAIYMHSLLWIQQQITGDVKIADGEQPEILPGAISNPDPAPTLHERKVASLGLAWYMLASIELQSGLPQKIHPESANGGNNKRLMAGEVWYDDHALRYYRRTGNSALLAETARRVAVTSVIIRASEAHDRKNDLENPDELRMRELNAGEMMLAASLFRSLVLASAVSMLVTEQYEPICELFKVIKERYQEFVIPGFAESITKQPQTFETILSSILSEISGQGGRTPITPDHLIRLQLMLLQAHATVIPKPTLAHLPHWTQQIWRETIGEQAFRLNKPGHFARELQKVQIVDGAPIASTARIVRLAADHVPVKVSPEYYDMLAELASQLA